MIHLRKKAVFLLVVLLLGMLSACNKERVNFESMTAPEQLSYARGLFNKKKYLKAKMQFSLLVLNNPGSTIVEEAQFFLAESSYHLKEYILAIAEYEKLIRSLPESPYVDNARYKIGMCYYKLAPKYHLDQEYTNKAIMQFDMFIEEYPDSELRVQVEARRQACHDRLAQKEYKTGELYRKMSYNRAAIISYDAVIQEYSSSRYVDDSLYWKAECHRKIMEYEDAIQAYQKLILRYPDSPLVEKAKEKMKDVQEQQKKQEAAQPGGSQS